MTEPVDPFAALEELVLLPADDRDRLTFEAGLAQRSAAVRERWHALIREDALLRERLARGAVPENLVDVLLALPGEMRTPAVKRRWRDVTIPWPVAAAVMLTVAGAGVLGYWEMNRPPVMVSLPAAPKEAVDNATLLALHYHDEATALDVKGSDVKVVTAALQKEGAGKLLFDVAIPEVPTDFHLLGGSVVPFGEQLGVYTRWETNGKIFTLYQFAPQSVGMPRAFATVAQIPTMVALKERVRVTLWPGPGGGCTWASVGDPAVAIDPFCGRSY